jgi:hypothetical protein
LKRLVLVFIFGGIFTLPALAVEESSARVFKLPKAKQLELSIPKTWAGTLKQPRHGLAPTVTLTPASGNTFKFLITVGDKPITDEKARSIVMKSLEDAKPQALEHLISVKEITGSANNGYYFYATDKSQKPKEHRYMTQGLVRTESGSLVFTLLSNDGAEPEVAGMIESLRTAKHGTAQPTVQSATAHPQDKMAALDFKESLTPKRNNKWSNASLDLTHCLNRETNTEIIKCAE